MKEKALLFGRNHSLIGIVTEPASNPSENNLPAIFLLNAGILHRVGPNRLHVKLARMLAKSGFTVFRFDFSGVGDSVAADDKLSLDERVISEIQDAMERLGEIYDVKSFILSGICSGAIVSVKTACRDPRVTGIVPINAAFQSSLENEELKSHISNQTNARRLRKLGPFNPHYWLKLVKGEVNYKKIIYVIDSQIRSLIGYKKEISHDTNNFRADLHLLIERGVNSLFIYSDLDPSLDYLNTVLGKEIYKLSKNGKFRVEIIQNTDHTFTLLKNQRRLIEIISDWAQKLVQN